MYLPRITPTTITTITETIVKIMPSAPLCKDFSRFIPNPSPTTDACRRYLDSFLLNFGYGMPKQSAKTSPTKRAIGADITVTPQIKLKGMNMSARSTQ